MFTGSPSADNRRYRVSLTDCSAKRGGSEACVAPNILVEKPVGIDGDIAAYRGLSNGGFCQVGRRPAESRNEDGLWWTEKRSEGKVGMVLGRFEDSVHRHQRRTLRVGLALVLSIAGGSRTSSRLLSAAL
jgi:hypothetical protein